MWIEIKTTALEVIIALMHSVTFGSVLAPEKIQRKCGLTGANPTTSITGEPGHMRNTTEYLDKIQNSSYQLE